jgi:hypothetical protein
MSTATSTSPDLQAFRQAVQPKDHASTTLCFVKSITADAMEISFDFGVNWDTVPVSEVTGAEVVKRVERPAAQYDLARLYLKESHPTIEIAALSAQVRHLQKSPGCDCGTTPANQRGLQVEGADPDPNVMRCGDICAGLSGCEWTRCLFWCAFLR